MKNTLIITLAAFLLAAPTATRAQTQDRLQESADYTRLVSMTAKLETRIQAAQLRINTITRHPYVKQQFNDRLARIKEDVNKTNQFISRQYITLAGLTSELNRIMYAESRMTYLLRNIDSYFNGIKRIVRIRDRYRMVRDAARDTDNEIARKLIQDITADFDTYEALLRDKGAVEAAYSLLRSIEDRIESAFSLVQRKQQAEQVVLRNWERLQNLLARQSGTDSTPNPLKKRIDRLTGEIETALAAKEYLKASRLINTAERMALDALATREQTTDTGSLQQTPAATGRRMLQDLQDQLSAQPRRRAEQLRPLLREAAGLLDDADDFTEKGADDQADAAARRAVRLLLRTRDALKNNHNDGSAADRAAQLQQDVRQLLDRAVTSVSGAGTRVLEKAEDFYRRGTGALADNKPRKALKHLQAARKLAERSLHLRSDEKRDGTRGTRLNSELEAVRRMVRDASAETAGNMRARALCSLAGELVVKAEQAAAAGLPDVAAEKLIAASRCARRAVRLSSAPAQDQAALKAETEQEAAVLAKTLPQLQPRVVSSTQPEATHLYNEAEAMKRRGDDYMRQGQLEAARMSYATANTFTSRAAGMLNYEEQAGSRITATLNEVKRRTAAADAANPDAASLLKLADDFVRKASRNLAAGALRMAEEQAGAALSLAVRAGELGPDTAADMDENLDTRIKTLDRDIERAKQLLQ